MKIRHIATSETQRFVEQPVAVRPATTQTLSLTGEKKQEILGFGGCFNELGWDALQRASKEDREAFMRDLFSPEGCGFTCGRVSIGANDFSLSWYSCDESEEDDYDLTHFSIERDKKYTLPYIHEAQKSCPQLTLFASPWSPPVWMKTKKAYNFGRIRMEPAVLSAYAKYFCRFVEAYDKEGVDVSMVHVQNEPMADQKFPSCLWYGCDMRDFIKGYLGPEMEKAPKKAEIWLGTINGPFTDIRWPGPGNSPDCDYFDQFANTILSDDEARRYITGVGVQWGGKHQIDEILAAYPEMRVMQTESECGDSLNDWPQMEYIFRQMWRYFRVGAERYVYWNMALMEGGISTWGWRQNSLVTVSEEGKLTLQPEYYLMKHFSHFVKKGARYCPVQGRWAANTVAFENPDGTLVLVVGSSMNEDRPFTFTLGDESFTEIIPAHTIHTFVIEP